ncbi:electron transfer flavoprotein subunit beta/FixA family protein [Portibacter lacus]|uniref:Electron transfer flavoprotein subunit beta n=1 Tax=Portibacter lacus TaxID=1099794 RepID=A0AA37WD97_9BACT|nr:electron transfer flavoprotein subunit beta/FixA family protein [Portibacter lacus]GLR15702.1 electron transfer flavoprotein subunit alpha [Portibacter lacus]
MKFLVCISKTPETTAKIGFTNDNKEFDTNGVQFIMNPYDEWYALVRALELKEKLGGEVVAINVGPASNDIIIRKALAIGADKAIRVNAEPESAFAVAKYISDHAKSENYDIIFTGKETIDYNGSEVPGMIAEFLDLPFISYASKLELEGSSASIERDIEGGVEGIKLDTPFVLSAAKGLAEQRIPNMRGIMMAKRKPLEVVEPAVVEEPVSIASFELPEKKEGVKMVDPENMEELVRLLHEEAKVI